MKTDCKTWGTVHSFEQSLFPNHPAPEKSPHAPCIPWTPLGVLATTVNTKEGDVIAKTGGGGGGGDSLTGEWKDALRKQQILAHNIWNVLFLQNIWSLLDNSIIAKPDGRKMVEKKGNPFKKSWKQIMREL